MLDPARWPEADAILERALDLAPDDRTAFLRATVKGDASLLANLEAVVAEAEAADGFLEPGGAAAGSLYQDFCRGLVSAHDTAPRLEVGSQFGPYHVTAQLGRGGMGEVYRARDPRLNRDVAIKVLPVELAGDPIRLARFEREARVLASVNHPRIGGIHHLVEHDGIGALVLELVDGPTLADRLQSGPLPITEALLVARDVAEALEAAHARGIVHRDLKPANVKLTAEGRAKVLDFGLAKALGPDAQVADDDGRNWLDTGFHVPGQVIGTAAYMSPEQAQGLKVDHRTDIWAFGCVVFEMLAGRRAFSRSPTTGLVAPIPKHEPDFGALPAETPPSIRRLLRHCLQEDPARRLGFIGDALLDLEDARRPVVEETAPPRPAWTWRWLAAVAVLGVVAGVAGTVGWTRRAPLAVARLSITLPPGDELITGASPSIAISPDGRTIVYCARRNGVIRLYRRDLAQLEPAAIPDSERAKAPFLSPDGRWAGFDRDGVLLRVPLVGGPALRIAEAPGGATASWGAGDRIVFSASMREGLFQVPASGGAATPLTQLDAARGEIRHLFPEVLPAGDAVLLTVARRDATDVAVARIDSQPTTARVLTEGRNARYLSPGFLVFVREGALWAAAFDVDRLELRGGPVPLPEPLHAGAPAAAAHFAVALTGTLVYAPRPDDERFLLLREVPEPASMLRAHLVHVAHWDLDVRARIETISAQERAPASVPGPTP